MKRQSSKVIVTGSIGKIEAKFSPTGEFICEFTLAVNHKKKEREFPNWYKGAIWGKQGELFNNLVQVGTLVEIMGEFMIEPWTTKDGKEGFTNLISKVYTFDVCEKGKPKTDNPYDESTPDVGDGENMP